jgi:hypothetical protein
MHCSESYGFGRSSTFRIGINAALDASDGLRAALHTPAWVRSHLENARLLLLYDRRDFVQGEWPEELREQVAEMTQRMEAGSLRQARVIFGKDGREEVRLAQFLIAEVPVAAVRQHLVRFEQPPPLADIRFARRSKRWSIFPLSLQLPNARFRHPGGRMQRRGFIKLTGAAGANLSLQARAQEAGHTYRLGFLIPAMRTFAARERDVRRIPSLNGFVEGQNLVIVGSFGVTTERIADGVAALAKAAPGAIVSGPALYTRALESRRVRSR